MLEFLVAYVSTLAATAFPRRRLATRRAHFVTMLRSENKRRRTIPTTCEASGLPEMTPANLERLAEIQKNLDSYRAKRAGYEVLPGMCEPQSSEQATAIFSGVGSTWNAEDAATPVNDCPLPEGLQDESYWNTKAGKSMVARATIAMHEAKQRRESNHRSWRYNESPEGVEGNGTDIDPNMVGASFPVVVNDQGQENSEKRFRQQDGQTPLTYTDDSKTSKDYRDLAASALAASKELYKKAINHERFYPTLATEYRQQASYWKVASVGYDSLAWIARESTLEDTEGNTELPESHSYLGSAREARYYLYNKLVAISENIQQAQDFMACGYLDSILDAYRQAACYLAKQAEAGETPLDKTTNARLLPLTKAQFEVIKRRFSEVDRPLTINKLAYYANRGDASARKELRRVILSGLSLAIACGLESFANKSSVGTRKKENKRTYTVGNVPGYGPVGYAISVPRLTRNARKYLGANVEVRRMLQTRDGWREPTPAEKKVLRFKRTMRAKKATE